MVHDEAGLGTLLRRLIGALDGGTQQIYDGMGVDFRPRFYPVARHLLQRGPAAVSQLSELLGTTQPATSQTLHEMDRAGLIDFRPGEDRRVRMASLSPKGRALCRRLEPVWEAAAQAAGELGAEVGAELTDLATRALDALEQRPFATRIEERLK